MCFAWFIDLFYPFLISQVYWVVVATVDLWFISLEITNTLWIDLISLRMEASCLDLALEGERLCKAGDYRAGVSFFESAIQVGTEDLQILSAIYSQLGNAYFHLQDYNKALEYHRHDLTLTR